MEPKDTQIKVGSKLPNSVLKKIKENLQLDLSNTKSIVLYFYPKDDTPGCTIEAQNFRDLYLDFKNLNCEIIGISRDTIKSHEKFICKYELPFMLYSDESQELCNLFDVIKPKNMYGKMVTGIERSTFIIDQNEVLQKEWRKVTVENHAEEVLETIKSLPI